MLLRAGQFKFVFPRPVLVMGIVNVTPDSFYDGGKWFTTRSAVRQGLKLAEQGADILDIGGESTRPRARPVSEREELRRVIPVLEQLAAKVKIPLSIDTMKPRVARVAIQAGASIVNDVAANRGDDEMWRLVAETRAGYVCMHMQGTPHTMQTKPVYDDVVREVADFFSERIHRMRGCGMGEEQIILDPGIGFGKTTGHNLKLLGALRSFRTLKRPLLLGVSRKSFMKSLLGAEPAARLPGALACTTLAVNAGVQIIRTHDVSETAQAIRMTEAILARQK